MEVAPPKVPRAIYKYLFAPPKVPRAIGKPLVAPAGAKSEANSYSSSFRVMPGRYCETVSFAWVSPHSGRPTEIPKESPEGGKATFRGHFRSPFGNLRTAQPSNMIKPLRNFRCRNRIIKYKILNSSKEPSAGPAGYFYALGTFGGISRLCLDKTRGTGYNWIGKPDIPVSFIVSF